MVLSGTHVMEGSGKILVTAVGVNSQVSRKISDTTKKYLLDLFDLSGSTLRYIITAASFHLIVVRNIIKVFLVWVSAHTPEHQFHQYLDHFPHWPHPRLSWKDFGNLQA